MATTLSVPSGVQTRGTPQPKWLGQLQGPRHCCSPLGEGSQSSRNSALGPGSQAEAATPCIQVSTQDRTPITASPQPPGRVLGIKMWGSRDSGDTETPILKKLGPRALLGLMLSQLSAGGRRGAAVSYPSPPKSFLRPRSEQWRPGAWGPLAADFSKQLSCLPQVCPPPPTQAVAPLLG